MIKRLLPICLAFGGIFTMSAENKLYNTTELGDVNGVADNGKYVAISDNDNLIAYLWDSSDPEEFQDITPFLDDITVPAGQRIKGASANDVSDSGLVVGGIHYADGKTYPAYYDGERWTRLEIPEDMLNNSECVAITPDGSIIAGYCSKRYIDYDGSAHGQYYPIQWKRNSDGDYELISHHDLDYYDHQGFWPTCMNTAGNVIGGILYCGVASSVPALVADGKLVVFDEISTKLEPFSHYFNGVLKYECERDADGKQVWTEDPNDPNIKLYPTPYIDGVLDDDMEGTFVGGFSFCDKYDNFYGYRTRVKSVDEDGTNAQLQKGAALYNHKDDTWKYNQRSSYYTCGDGDSLIFADNNIVWVDGVKEQLTERYDLSGLPSESAGIAKISLDGKVLGGVRQEFMSAIGQYIYFPYVIVCDGAFNAVKTVGMDDAAIIVGRGYVACTQGELQVYDMNGRLAGTGNRVNLPSGAYVIKAGNKTHKVMVK